MNNAPLVAGLAAVIGAAFSYLTATRKASGRIATTEAESLWHESASIRKFLAEQLAKQDDRIRELQTEIRRLERENFELRQQIKGLT